MSWVGKTVHRKEDDRLVRGKGLFVDDYKMGGMLHMKLVTSPYAHAKIGSIDVSAAGAMPGVVCTLTGAEVAEQTQPFMELAPDPGAKIQDYCMAVGKVRFQGEPVAAVVAETAALAADAATLIDVDYDMLDPIVDAEVALEDKTILHETAGPIWFGTVSTSGATSTRRSTRRPTSSRSTKCTSIGSPAHPSRTMRMLRSGHERAGSTSGRIVPSRRSGFSS